MSYARPHPGAAARGAAVAFATALALVWNPSSAHAQAAGGTGTLQGRVSAAGTGVPLGGVTVEIVGTDRRTETGRDGTFRFDEVPAGPTILRASLSGHAATTDRISVWEGLTSIWEIRMEGIAVALDELIVFGERRPPEAQVPAVQARTAAEAAAEIPGVTIYRSSGVGGGARFLIRGANSMSLSNWPAVYVDGVRVSGFEGRSFGTPDVSILDLVPVEDVDSIAVYRGASAEAAFGGETGNGVILVYTRRGGN